MELPPEVQQQLVKFQQLQNQLAVVQLQKQHAENSLRLVERAIAEVEKAEGQIFVGVGSILVEKKKEDVLKELQDEKELLEIRIKSLSRQEEKLQKILLDLKNKIESALKNLQGAAVGDETKGT